MLIIHNCSMCCIAGQEWSSAAIDVFEELSHTAKWKPLMSKTVGQQTDGNDFQIRCVHLIDTNGPVVVICCCCFVILWNFDRFTVCYNNVSCAKCYSSHNMVVSLTDLLLH